MSNDSLKGMRSEDIVKALKGKYGSYQFATFSELRIGTGYGDGREQRIDFWALDCHGENERLSFEIKISRADFLSEMRKPQKRRAAMAYSNRFYFVTPPGLIKAEEIPNECGLIEVFEREKFSGMTDENWAENVKNYGRWECKTKIKAIHRETIRPNWRLVASLARRVCSFEAAD